MTRTRLAFLSLLLVALAATPADAQKITGRVLMAGTGQPLNEVLVVLRTADGRAIEQTVTDTAGEFVIFSPRTGMLTLRAELIGMTSVETAQLRVSASETVEVELRMAETAVPLEPLTVRARKHDEIGPLAGYFRRVENNQRIGTGTVFTRDRLAERQALDVSDVLQGVPRVSIVSGTARRGTQVYMRSNSGQCLPRIYINGMYWNRPGADALINDIVKPSDLEGIEVYSGRGEIPAEYYDESGCGVILLWTRRDPGVGSPMTWRRAALAAAGIGFMLILFSR